MGNKRNWKFYNADKGVDTKKNTVDDWLSTVIATAVYLGISKSELLNEYYYDELADVIGEIIKLKYPSGNDGEGEEFVGSVDEFFE